MAKELPYFQFEPAQYLTGSIQFCSLQAQGLFINILSIYWQRSCDLTLEQIKKRFNCPDILEELLSENIIKVVDDKICIEFLHNQFNEVIETSKKRSESGKKGLAKRWGGDSKPIAKPLQTDSKPIAIREDKIKEDKKEKKGRSELFIDHVNSVFGKNFRHTQKVKSSFNSRINIDGYKSEELAAVIENIKKTSYHIETNFGHVTPEFLLRQSIIEKYKSGPIIQIKQNHATEQPKGQQYDPETDIYSQFN